MKKSSSYSKWHCQPKNIFLFLSCFLFCSILYSDDVGIPIYQEGSIYLKIIDSSNTELSVPGSNNNMPAEIETLFVQYGVSMVSKPFEILNRPKFDRTYRIEFNNVDEESFIADLERLTIVDYAERVAIRAPDQVIPNDPSAQNPSPSNGNSYQLDLSRTYYAFEENNTGGSRIAIVDNAINVNHEDLFDNYVLGVDITTGLSDPSPPTNNGSWAHGTHVAGVACGVTDNGLGIASPGWNNQLLAVKVVPDNAPTDLTTYSTQGIAWAIANNADVINLSYGGSAPSETEYAVIEEARQNNIIVIASAGNNNTANPHYPAAYGEGVSGQPYDDVFDKRLVIAVASIDENNQRSIFNSGGSLIFASNFGTWVDVAAYGSDIYSCEFGADNYIYGSGTSQAAPLVAGIAGLVIHHAPNATDEEIIDCLVFSANPDIYDISTNISGTLGSGRIDAWNAMLCIQPNCDNPLAVISSNSQIICNDGSEDIVLSANTGTAYEWNNGATTQSITVNQPGSYSVTVTFSGGCTASTTKILETVDASIIALSTDGTIVDGPLCGKNFVTLTGFWGTSYLWSGSGSTSQTVLKGNGSNVSEVSNTSVTITDVGGCEGVVEVVEQQIIYHEEPEIIIEIEENSGVFNDGLICNGTTSTVTLTADLKTFNDDTYLWNTGETTPSISVLPTASTTYSVTVTNINDCSSVQEVTIDFVICPDNSCFCPGGADNNIGIDDGQVHNFSDLASSSTSLWNKECISFKGRIRFDVGGNTSMGNSNVYLHPGTEFIIPAGKSFDIGNSKFAACSNMWKGILVESGGELIFEDNEIRDAQFAITALGGTALRVSNNLFDRNFVGFFVPTPTINSPNIFVNQLDFGFFTFRDNKFSCSSDLLGEYSGQLPLPGSTSYAGILINMVDYLPIDDCIFKDMKNGIQAYNSNLLFRDSRITNMIGNNAPDHIPFYNGSDPGRYNNSGIGVFVNNSQSFQIYNSQISNCNYGIVGKSVESHFYGNTIEAVRYGAVIKASEGQQTWIDGNEISCSEIGVSLYDCNQGDVRVNENIINISLTGQLATVINRIGIGLYNTMLAPQLSNNDHNNGGVGDIRGNQINLTSDDPSSYMTGIEISNSTYFNLQDNIINELNSLSPGPKRAISIVGSSYGQIRDNIISGPSLTGSLSNTVGFYVMNSVNMGYCCNEISAVKEGAFFSGMSDDTEFRVTKFTDIVSKGLIIGNGGIIGPQGAPNDYFSGNLWINGAGAEHQGSLQDIQQSPFYINPGVDNSYPDPIPIPNQGWFIPSAGATQLNCINYFNCNIPIYTLSENEPIDERDLVIAGGTLEEDSYGGGIRWEGKRHLYRKIIRNELLGEDTSIDNFFQLNSSVALGGLIEIDTAISDLGGANNQILTSIGDKRNIVKSILEEIWIKDSLISVLPEGSYSDLLIEKELLKEELNSLLLELNSLEEDYKLYKLNVAGNISTQNNNIVANEVFEQNRKTMNEIYLDKISLGKLVLDQIDLTRIRDIAEQCPLSGGNAVFQARGILKMVSQDSTFYDDDLLCGQIMDRDEERLVEDSNINGMEIYPNPATKVLNLSLENMLKSNSIFKVYDLAGKEISSFFLSRDQTQFQFDISDIQSGIYFYECDCGDTTFKGKIIIIN